MGKAKTFYTCPFCHQLLEKGIPFANHLLEIHRMKITKIGKKDVLLEKVKE